MPATLQNAARIIRSMLSKSSGMSATDEHDGGAEGLRDLPGTADEAAPRQKRETDNGPAAGGGDEAGYLGRHAATSFTLW